MLLHTYSLCNFILLNLILYFNFETTSYQDQIIISLQLSKLTCYVFRSLMMMLKFQIVVRSVVDEMISVSRRAASCDPLASRVTPRQFRCHWNRKCEIHFQIKYQASSLSLTQLLLPVDLSLCCHAAPGKTLKTFDGYVILS